MRESRVRCRGCGSPARRRPGLVAPRRVWLRRRQSGAGSPFLMLVLCFWMTISASAMVRADTLAEAMASAYETNPTLLAARKQLAGVDEQVAQALSFWRPRADVVAGGGYIKDLSGEDESTRTANTQFSTTDGPTVLNLEVRQPIYNFSNSPRVRQAEEQVRSGRARPHRGRAGCAPLRAAIAYLDLFRAEASLRYSTDYEDALQKSLESTRRQFELGLVRNSSVAQAESRLAAATAQRIQAEGVLASARSNYAQVIGKSANTVVMPDMPADLPQSADEVIEAAAAYNPSLVAARYDERSAREGVDVIAGQKPRVSEFKERLIRTRRPCSAS